MYKKKSAPTAPSGFSYTPYIASGCTLVVILLSEYLFHVPSVWIHGMPEMPMGDILRDRPTCTEEYAPVCGKDGRTYSNSCMLREAGTSVARVGKCDTDPSPGSSSEEGIPIAIETEADPAGDIATEVSEAVIDLSKYQVYTNSNYKYSLALPKSVYYQGSAGKDRKSHRLAVGLSASGVESFSDALIRLEYYPNGEPALEGVQQTINLDTGIMTVSYEGTLPLKGQEILKAIEATAKSL